MNNAGVDTTHLHWDSWDWQSHYNRAFPDANVSSSYTSSAQDCPTIHFNGSTSVYPDQGVGNNIHSGFSSVTPPVLSPPLTPVHKIKQGNVRLVIG